MYDLDDVQTEYDDYEYDDFDEFEDDFDEGEMDWDDEFDDDEETELALELLSASDEEELGSILSRIVRPAIRLMRSPGAREAVKRVILRGKKFWAKKAWPVIKKYGPWAPLPWDIYDIYRSSKKEFDDDADEMQLEIAKKTVRVIRTAAQKAAKAAQAGVPPKVAAVKAVKSAVKKHAPSLIKKEMYYYPRYGRRYPGYRRHRSGRWVKRGRNLIAYGAY